MFFLFFSSSFSQLSPTLPGAALVACSFCDAITFFRGGGGGGGGCLAGLILGCCFNIVFFFGTGTCMSEEGRSNSSKNIAQLLVQEETIITLLLLLLLYMMRGEQQFSPTILEHGNISTLAGFIPGIITPRGAKKKDYDNSSIESRCIHSPSIRVGPYKLEPDLFSPDGEKGESMIG